MNNEHPPIDQDVQPSGVQCVRCGYDMSGQSVQGQCPECGTRSSESLNAAIRPPASSSPKALASLILGITGLVGCLGCALIPLVLSPLAVVFGYLAKKDVDAGTISPQGKGLITAGIILGVAGTILSLFGVGAMVFAIVYGNP